MSQESPKRNREESNSLPMVVLLILVGIVCLFLFIGWKYVSDEPSTISELTPTTPEEMLKSLPEENEVTSTAEEEDLGSEDLVTDAKIEKIEPIQETKSTEKESTSQGTGNRHLHIVQANETLFSIATRYNISMETMKKLNPTVDPNSIKVGITSLSVPVQAIHTVGPGDILRVVASKYGITVEQLMKANGKSKNFAERGEKLVIPHAQRQ